MPEQADFGGLLAQPALGLCGASDGSLAERSRANPDRASYRWFARELGMDVWSVVRVSRAYPRFADELEAALEPDRSGSLQRNHSPARHTDDPYVGEASQRNVATRSARAPRS